MTLSIGQVTIESSWSLRSRCCRVDNIVATLPGRNPTGSVVLARTTTRWWPARAPPTMVPLITDGEEPGLLGAAAFARQNPLAGQRAVVLNWEARGVSGPSLMFETSCNNAALVKFFAAAAPYPNGDSSMVEFYLQLPHNTDFTELAGASLPGMNFAYIQGAARYHTPGDTIANLDLASLQHHGANMLGLTRALGNTDLATLVADHDATYFRFLGPVITYPIVLVWPLALLAVLACAALVVLARRRRQLSIPRLLLGVASVVLPLAAAAVAAQSKALPAWRTVRYGWVRLPSCVHPRPR